ncbi:hypothetical protein JCM30566_05310 [Marinitoga arctica]
MPDINIKQIIHEELSILVDLFYYLEKLKNAILNNDEIASLNSFISKISENALKLSKIEKERIEIFKDISERKNIKNNLEDFINLFKNEDPELYKMLRELSSKFVDVSSMNKVLRDLLKAKLEYNDILIKLFMEPKNNVPVYNRTGIKKQSTDQSKINWQG